MNNNQTDYYNEYVRPSEYHTKGELTEIKYELSSKQISEFGSETINTILSYIDLKFYEIYGTTMTQSIKDKIEDLSSSEFSDKEELEDIKSFNSIFESKNLQSLLKKEICSFTEYLEDNDMRLKFMTLNTNVELN